MHAGRSTAGAGDSECDRTNRKRPARHGAAGRLVERHRSSVTVFDASRNPNATIRLTLLNFQSQLTTQDNLLFATVLLVTIPRLIMFMIFKPEDRRRHGRRPSQGLSWPTKIPGFIICERTP